MKKTIFILVMCIATNALAQNSFPTENAIWNEQYSPPYGDFHQYGLKGDTIINDILYQKLYVLSDTTLDCISEQSQPYGFTRQLDQRVYFKPYFWDYSTDILLYDFGVSVGDTVWHGGSMSVEGIFHVNEKYSIIKEIEIENDKKTYYVDRMDMLPEVWYEGIGSFRGLFGHITPIPLYNNFPNKLVCFKHNDNVEFLDNPTCNKCFCTSSNIDDLILEKINIYPNPTKDVLNIEVQENTKIKSISIYSMDGKLIKKSKYSYNSEKINITSLKSGSYIINLETDKGNFNQIIIKN